MKQLLLVAFLACSANAQHLSYGVKLGAPITDIIENKGAIKASTARLTIGPELDLRLPAGFGIEFDMLYKRYTVNSQSSGSWEFPLVGKYRMPGLIARPYAEAGFVFNKLSNVASFQLENRKGFLLGAGLDVKLSKLHVAPELRYTHYGKGNSIPAIITNANQAEFLVGITF